jgi:hypothetical protein
MGRGRARLLDRFRFLPAWRIDDVMVSFAAAGGSVGAHVDQYDVFLLQAQGRRRWQIDADPRAPRDFRPDVELKLLQRFRPSHDWVLEPGDMLYLPPGVPHHGEALEPCMTFSIGMRAPSRAELLVDLAEELAASLPDEERYADPDLVEPRDAFEIDDAAFARVDQALSSLATMDAKSRRRWFGASSPVTGPQARSPRAEGPGLRGCGQGPGRRRPAAAPSLRAHRLGQAGKGGAAVRRRRGLADGRAFRARARRLRGDRRCRAGQAGRGRPRRARLAAAARPLPVAETREEAPMKELERAGFRVEPADYAVDFRDLRAIREPVFVDEQKVPLELEWDELDPACHHVIARDDEHRPIGTGRLTPEHKIGRMAF